uniref:Ig-like domain-containing protein n=1 Tax=Panagrolaimus sp. JU765 TaxID=591449 RepID=A0AC34Q231_9BILA
MAERPKFIQPLLDRTFSDGKPMKLDIRVEGSPFPELKWMKDWKPIVESHRIKDSGIYSVIAINDAGQSTTSCTVTVEADGEYNDVQLPRKKVTIESKKLREIYEIDESEEK